MNKKNPRFISKANGKSVPAVQDRTIFYTDIAYMPPALKNQTWAAQMIYFAKKNSRLFLDPIDAAKYRQTDSLILDTPAYKKMVDPITPEGSGGKATYFYSNFKANPIYIHLKNIVKAQIQRMAKQLEVNLVDKFAKTRKMKDNYRILYRNYVRDLINELAPSMGLPKLTDSQDPFKWMAKIVDGQDGQQAQGQPAGQEDSDMIDNYVDLIKNEITDSADMALYNEYIYKGDYEIVFEKGLQHYILNYNKWIERWSDDFLDDMMHFNRAVGEYYTDEITGRPVIKRFAPEQVWTSAFKTRDGSDMMFYFVEYYITFADFVKTIGKNLTPEKLKEVFLWNKTQGSTHGLNWVDWMEGASVTRDRASIRVGKMSCLTQDYDVFMDDVQATFPKYQQMEVDWYPEEGSTATRDEKHYNVWYSWYYIPPTTQQLSAADYAWQANFIFDIKKNQDQQRFGEDGRYSKSPLVIIDNSGQASFTDITQFWMPMIHHATHKFQNCLVSDLDAVALSEDFLGSLLSAVDEDNGINPGNPTEATGGNGRDAAIEQWKQIKQGGMGFLRMTDPKTGAPLIDPAKLVVPIKNGQLERAERYIQLIALMYDQMTKSLAMAPIAAGEEVKPRTPVAALQESIKSSDDATFFIQKLYEEFLKMFGERMVQYMIEIAKEAKEGNKKRFSEFMDVVGVANALLLEGMEDVPPESVGMTVNYVDNASKKDFVFQLATQYVKLQQIDEDFLYLIMGADNWKYSFVLLKLAIKRRKQEQAIMARQQQQDIMEQKRADLQIALALAQGKAQGVDQNIVTKGKVEEALQSQMISGKHQSQAELTSQKGINKMNENLQKQSLEKDLIDHQKALEAATPFANTTG